MTHVVTDNHSVAHRWAQANPADPYARSGNGNFYFDGPGLYSYGEHFPLAFHLPGGLVIENSDPSSVTTNGKHRPALNRALRGRSLRIPGLGDSGWRHIVRDAWAQAEGPAHPFAVFRDGMGRPFASDAHAFTPRDREAMHAAARRLLPSVALSLDSADFLALAQAFGVGKSAGAIRRKAESDARKAKVAAEKAEAARALRSARAAVESTEADFAARLRRMTAQACDTESRYAAERGESALKEESAALMRAGRLFRAKGWTRKADAAKARRARVRAVLDDLDTRQARASARSGLRRALAAIRAARMAESDPVGYLGEIGSISRHAFPANAPGCIRSADAAPAGSCRPMRSVRDAREEFEEAGPEARAATRLDAMESAVLCVGIAAENGAAAAGRLGKHSVARRLTGLEAATAGAFLSALATREARQEAAREARAAIVMAEAREKIEAWRNGAPGRPPYVPGAGPLLRAVNVERDESGNVAGGELQTTQGARVPLTHAIRVFRFLKLCRERGAGWTANGRVIRVGHFTVDRIEPNGDFTAGCHSIRWAEVAALAERLGLSDIAADDSAAVARARA